MRSQHASQSQSARTTRAMSRSQFLKHAQDKPPPQAPPSTEREASTLKHYLAVRDRIHDGPFYTILNDGMKNGLKRKRNDSAPTEASLFNPFTDNQTYSAKYFKVRRKLPKLDVRPYGKFAQLLHCIEGISSFSATHLFPRELRSLLGGDAADGKAANDGQPPKKRTLQISKSSAVTRIENYIEQQGKRLKEIEEHGEELEEEFDEEEADEEKPDAVDEEDNWSAISSDSEESGDDYNAERYFDNGDDDDFDEGDPNENTYE